VPTHKLDDETRRALTLAALTTDRPTDLAKEYGVSRAYVHKLKKEAATNPTEKVAEAQWELDFRMEVEKLAREEKG
jgi:AraC-like DNA-binding protein